MLLSLVKYWPEILFVIVTSVACLPLITSRIVPLEQLVTKGAMSHTYKWWSGRHNAPAVTLYMPKHLMSPRGLELRQKQNRNNVIYILFVLIFIFSRYYIFK